MITSVKGENIKGLTFEQPLGRLTLILGPNGAGKSVRRDALLLALMGYIPGSAKKTNPEIFAAFSSSKEKMVVGFKTDGGYEFERGFVKQGDSVKQGYKVNKAKSAKEFYYETLGKSGGIKAVDVGAFMELSDQKKIDMLLELYPPKEDLTGIIDAATKGRAKILDFEDKARAKEAAAAELLVSKAALNLPPGTLADCAGAIIHAEAQLELAQENLNKANQEQAAAAAATEATAKAEEKAKAAAAEAKKKTDDAAKKQAETIKAHEEKAKQLEKAPELPLQPVAPVEPGQTSVAEKGEERAKGTMTVRELENFVERDAVLGSFKFVLEAFNEADCGSCMARLVVLREFKKYRKEG